MKSFLAALLLGISALPPAGTLAQPDDKLDLAAAAALFDRWKGPDSPGCAVSVTQGQQRLFAGAYGSAILETRTPNTPTTSFHIASVSKQFTAFAIHLLQAEGKLSVEDNVLAILETRDLDETARQERLEQILAELRIAHVRKSLGLALSGGERRRVEIARALAAEPRFVLLDEPFAGVDPLSVIDIQRIMTELTAKGIGVLITDHNVRETLGVCGRAYIVSGGTVIASGSSEEILANPQVREVYLGQSFRM